MLKEESHFVQINIYLFHIFNKHIYDSSFLSTHSSQSNDGRRLLPMHRTTRVGAAKSWRQGMQWS